MHHPRSFEAKGPLPARTGQGRVLASWGVAGAALLALTLILGASWQEYGKGNLTPAKVSHIQDGVSSKHEILAMFGDPQEIERSDEGPVYKYTSYRDAPYIPSTDTTRKSELTSEMASQQFIMDQDKKIKKPPAKRGGKVLGSTLIIRFKSDGLTVMSHEYKEY